MADTRESLSARFKRVLGRNIVDEDLEDAQNGTTKSKNPTTSRRREQVLNAQRTHRNRTQQYIRELEKEVFRLRDENEALRTHVAHVKQTITAAGGATVLDGLLTPPVQHRHGSSHQQSEFDSSPPSSDGGTMVSVDLTALGSVSPQHPCGKRAANITPPVYEAPVVTPSQQRSIGDQPPPAHNSNGRGGELTAQIGISFVLTLESPCLPHVKYTFEEDNRGVLAKAFAIHSGSSHSLTATSILVHRYRERNLEKLPLQLPSQEIERLLEASARLRLDGEVTPVQIWYEVKELGRRRGYDATGEELEALIEEFGKYIYCNSFGAVVQTATAEAILNATFNTKE